MQIDVFMVVNRLIPEKSTSYKLFPMSLGSNNVPGGGLSIKLILTNTKGRRENFRKKCVLLVPHNSSIQMVKLLLSATSKLPTCFAACE